MAASKVLIAEPLSARTTVLIWYTCILGSLISLPLTKQFQAAYPQSPSCGEVILILLYIPLIAAIVYKILLTVSSYVLTTIKINPFVSHPFRAVCFPALPYGIALGIAFVVVQRFYPSVVLPSGALDTVVKLVNTNRISREWQLFGAVYATFNVEVVERLFLLPTVLYVLGRMQGSPEPSSNQTIKWASIFLTGFIAGIFPLIGIQPFVERSGSLLTSGLLESLVQGILLSWLFIKRGFWESSLAHFFIYLTVIIGVHFF
ncbi:hypothetical protein H0X06_05980 [Candidatus Dependentiae bacterium]|nr:hypothetical protein [Candidatus Dependentiae bacterium]